jgi:hypothetical protein
VRGTEKCAFALQGAFERRAVCEKGCVLLSCVWVWQSLVYDWCVRMGHHALRSRVCHPQPSRPPPSGAVGPHRAARGSGDFRANCASAITNVHAYARCTHACTAFMQSLWRGAWRCGALLAVGYRILLWSPVARWRQIVMKPCSVCIVCVQFACAVRLSFAFVVALTRRGAWLVAMLAVGLELQPKLPAPCRTEIPVVAYFSS